MLKALVLGYVIAGPIFNLTYNGKEVVRTFACTTHLTYNLTKTRFNLMFQPFQQALFGMNENTHDMRDTLASVKDLMSPIVEEIEGQDEMKRLNEENDYLDNIQGDTKRSEIIAQKYEKSQANHLPKDEEYEMKYREKIETRCEEQLSRGSERCRDMFGDMYNKCYDSVTWFAAWLLCWPMKLTFICNIVQALGGSNICDPEGKIDPGIGEGYATLKGARDKLSGRLDDARIQYKLNIAPSILDLHDASDTAKTVLHKFNERRNFFDSSMRLLKRCLALIFLKVIHSAQQYHDRYLSDIEYDNNYITPYFRKIDARRKARGSMILLPLKKIEKNVLIDSYSVMPSKREKKYFMVQSIKLILEMVTATTIVLLDIILFETLELVRKHGYVKYVQTGHHDVNLNVHGTGIIAKLISSVVRGFNMKKRVKMIISNGECLPLPNKLSNYVLSKIYGMYLAIWIMLFLASYTKRLQRRICNFYYVKREKRRILYLYNETLRRRVGYTRFMKNKVKSLVRQRLLERDMNLWFALKTNSPFWFGWLKFFKCSRLKCLICGESEPRKNSNFHKCTTPGCSFIHCPECWRDVENVCYACADLPESDTDSDDNIHGYDIKSVGVS
ncbi:hypothetical protein PV328_003063 [Microctonus aethiopoides]|uniref:Dendritic cell-specific transmembrane protein-like domain-containing protein n=1 Tax=Microctonus aethiopoides TaxID=144406 RepID=A0AA39F7L8_9HYME|nr:hypothetical protein PV328_003063 [Microctonus aethiopoides]